ncbi:MAG: AMP-binding protein [Pseudomonadota bacterium]
MSISYRGVYLTPSTSDYHACRLSDVSFYANHLYALFESSSYTCPSNIALQIDDEKISYEVLSGKINLCAAGFHALGVEQGDVIVFSLKKSLALIIGLMAAFKIGAKVCVLPEKVSSLRLRAIQQAMPIDFLINASGVAPYIQHDNIFLPRTFAYEQIMMAGVQVGSINVDTHVFMTSAQLVIHYDAVKKLHPIEFSQAAFLKAISQLEDILPALQPDQKISIATAVTKPCFILELFYAFSRQLTCVFVDKTANVDNCFAGHAVTLSMMNSTALFLEEPIFCKEIDIQGLRISLDEIEYFARQYPGITQVKASVSVEGIELHAQFSWDFYASLDSRCVAAADLLSPKDDADRLACRLFYFLAQHLWAELPIKTIILQPELTQ